MQRLSSWLVVLLALAVFVAAGYMVTKKDHVRDAGTVLPVDSVGVSTPSGGSASGSSSRSGSAGARTVAFLGDDWTAGIGASARSKRFTTLLAKDLGATERNFGVDGSGYAKASSSGGAYDDRIDDVVAARPDVVVVAGGRNDTADYVPTLQSRTKALFARLHELLPKATLVAVAPFWGDSDAPSDLAPVTAAVKRSVDAAGGTYLAVSDPIRGHPSYMASDADPNDKGYAAIAEALAPKLRALLT
ncbi:SGNH/GDSL hydrolase family protein [uncultured Jatrophihabitans sp.]|uniref:SGNH/GDSL hydrolase family protein n=1 Tax=uncultured Jatrophihabitans sp. TaxID=1610747 RepID=UPI0035CB83CD